VGKKQPRTAHETAVAAVDLIMTLVKSPNASGRYRRWVPVGWSPITHAGKQTPPPRQDAFLMRLRLIRVVGGVVDVWAETGEGDSTSQPPHMEVVICAEIDATREPQCYYDLAAALHQTVRHEIEHLLDEGFLAVPGTGRGPGRDTIVRERWQKSVRLSNWYAIRRKLFGGQSPSAIREWNRKERLITQSGARGKCVDYIVSAREMHAFVKGFQAEARYREVAWNIPMEEYVDSMISSGRMTHEEGDVAKRMLTRWAVRLIPRAPISEDAISRHL